MEMKVGVTPQVSKQRDNAIKKELRVCSRPKVCVLTPEVNTVKMKCCNNPHVMYHGVF